MRHLRRQTWALGSNDCDLSFPKSATTYHSEMIGSVTNLLSVKSLFDILYATVRISSHYQA